MYMIYISRGSYALHPRALTPYVWVHTNPNLSHCRSAANLWGSATSPPPSRPVQDNIHSNHGQLKHPSSLCVTHSWQWWCWSQMVWIPRIGANWFIRTQLPVTSPNSVDLSSSTLPVRPSVYAFRGKAANSMAADSIQKCWLICISNYITNIWIFLMEQYCSYHMW